MFRKMMIDRLIFNMKSVSIVLKKVSGMVNMMMSGCISDLNWVVMIM